MQRRKINVILKATVYGFVYGAIICALVLILMPSLSVYFPSKWPEWSELNQSPYKGDMIAEAEVVAIFHLLEGVFWGVCLGTPLGFITGCIIKIKSISHDDEII